MAETRAVEEVHVNLRSHFQVSILPVREHCFFGIVLSQENKDTANKELNNHESLTAKMSG